MSEELELITLDTESLMKKAISHLEAELVKIRAGKANLFLSDLFLQAFVNSTGVPVELFENDGSVGAALGAGIGAKIFSSAAEAFSHIKSLQLVEPTVTERYEPAYQDWLRLLNKQLI